MLNVKKAPINRRELSECVITLLAVIALLALCTIGPQWLGWHFGPGVGVASSVAALVVWVYIGPRPMPGFLSGIICLSGLATIAGIGISQLIRCIK
jgi:hypothetical protein